MDPSRFFTHSLRDPRVARILAAAIEAVDPDIAVERYLISNPLPSSRRIFALALGKAALPMTRALSRFADLTRALVITKHASPLHLKSATATVPDMGIIESGHPVPDARSLAAGNATLEFVSDLRENDLLVCLISGGGSALMTAPVVPLEDMQALTSALLACGARIDEINTLRRHLDRVKGGSIAKATKARVLSLILSDVVGSPLEAIASGPTAPDPTTKDDALAVLQKFDLLNKPKSHKDAETPSKLNRRDSVTPWQKSILDYLRSSPETPKADDPIFSRVQNVVVGDNALAVQAALQQVQKEGFQAESLGSDWQGEAREVGLELARKLRVAIESKKHSFCLVAGGETTVTIHGNGKGGRNQELALAVVSALAGLENALLISLATDGEDGPTDVAGAVVSDETLQRAEKLDLTVADYLSRNDAYRFFERLDDLLKIGPTGTNVNDLVFLLSM